MRDRIKEFLIEQKLSAKDFALKIGVQPSSVSHILTGRNKPSVELLEKLLKTFPDVDLKYLISGVHSGKNITSGGIDHEDSTLITTHDSEEHNSPMPQIDTNVTSDPEATKIVIFRTDGTFVEYSPR